MNGFIKKDHIIILITLVEPIVILSMITCIEYLRRVDSNLNLGLTVIPLIFPVILIFIFKRDILGYFLGVITHWASVYIVGIVERVNKPTYDGDFALGVWLFSGWFFGLLYCLPFYGLKKLYRFIVRKSVKKNNSN